MADEELRETVGELRMRIEELERRIDNALEVFAVSLQPTAFLLTSSGLDERAQQEVHAVIDEMSHRVDAGIPVPFVEFEERISRLVPKRIGDRQFLHRFIEALRLERPSAKRLLDQLSTAMALFRS